MTPAKSQPDECLVDGCATKPLARSYCNKHYQRLTKHGDVNVNHRDRPLADRFWEKVDKSGSCWLWTSAVAGNGYGQFHVGPRNASPRPSHRIAWELTHGASIPEGAVIDHICFTPLCVNPAHLRATTTKLNVEYRRRGRIPVPESGFRGVYRAKGKWLARLSHGGVAYRLGTYACKEEAAQAVAAKREELFKFPEFQGETA